jgi:tetratricopeptide (TPR) repeat protein
MRKGPSVFAFLVGAAAWLTTAMSAEPVKPPGPGRIANPYMPTKRLILPPDASQPRAQAFAWSYAYAYSYWFGGGGGGGGAPQGGGRRRSTPPGYSIYAPQPAYNNYYRPNYYPINSYYPSTESDREKARKTRIALHPSSSESRVKAGGFIAAGDAHFGKQKYPAAIERYRAAVRAAPDLAEPHLRLGFAMVAQGNYAGAAKAFRRGLELGPDWADSTFALESISAKTILAETNERLAKALADEPMSPDLLVATGLQLYFSGQRDRAGIYLAQAARLGAIDAHAVESLVPKPQAGAAAATDLNKFGF